MVSEEIGGMAVKRIWAAAALALLLCGCAAPGRQAAPQRESLPDHSGRREESGQELYRHGGVRVLFVQLQEPRDSGIRLELLVENGTSRNLALTGSRFVVNGVTVPGALYIQASAGTRCRGYLELYADGLDGAMIRRIREIRGKDVKLLDTDTFAQVAQVPFSLEALSQEEESVRPDRSGVELYRGEGICIKARALTDAFYGKTLQLLVENDLDRDILLEARQVLVNGCEVDAWMCDTVCGQTVRWCLLDLYDTSLAENGIRSIGSVALTVAVKDADSGEELLLAENLAVQVRDGTARITAPRA